VALGAAAPIVRRRLRLRARTVLATTALAPSALAVVLPPSRKRSVLIVCAQMWSYFAAYEMPADDADKQRSRVRIDYPIRVDRVLGLGRIPTVRLQHALHRTDRFQWWEKVLSWSHWVWFAVPHVAAAYVLVKRPAQFPRAAVQIYGTFDVGAFVYWAVPTAPPWFAAEVGRINFGDGPPLRRVMREYGEQLWGERWPQLYGAFSGNPLAAMPSLHFGTSVAAARALGDTGRIAGTIGWTYAATLGFALVYLGEHYVTDLAAGGALAVAIRRLAPLLSGPATRYRETLALLATHAAAAAVPRAPVTPLAPPAPGGPPVAAPSVAAVA
jgi:membrane-associated phospholipid phosphatase